FPGEVPDFALADLDLSRATVTSNPTTRTITVRDAEATLTVGLATTLNDVFNRSSPSPPVSSDFVVGDSLGAVSFTVEAR
ncbi:MAG TPA: hypothetical protein VFZ41_11165, partial [Solirubrobacterales bacterium]